MIRTLSPLGKQTVACQLRIPINLHLERPASVDSKSTKLHFRTASTHLQYPEYQSGHLRPKIIRICRLHGRTHRFQALPNGSRLGDFRTPQNPLNLR